VQALENLMALPYTIVERVGELGTWGSEFEWEILLAEYPLD
jgi:hypothetical protein